MTAPGSYVELTESWGMPMPHIEHEMIYRRYKYLADLADGRRLLEIGCGTGLGNHLLAASAAELFSFDLEYDNVDNGQHNAPGMFGCTDAQALPFSSESLDVVAACEMIYYVPDHERMLAEIRRVMRPGGAVFLAMANPERPGFHHSPFSTEYPSARRCGRAAPQARLRTRAVRRVPAAEHTTGAAAAVRRSDRYEVPSRPEARLPAAVS